MCGAHYRRALLYVLDRFTSIGIAVASTPEMTIPITSGGPFLVFLANFVQISMQTSGVTASNMEHYFVAHSIGSAQRGL